MTRTLAYIWDYDIDEDKLKEILSGKVTIARLDRRWAIVRLFEYAPYKEVVRLLGYKVIVDEWPEARRHVRSDSRKRGFDFLIEWLKKRHPEKIL